MKPVRGSGRASSRGPKTAAERKMHKPPKSKPSAESRKSSGELGNAGRSLGLSSSAGTLRKASATVGKSKNQGSWKPLSKSSSLALENMLSLSVLSVLTLKHKEKAEVQMHLNRFKDGFLSRCAQLSVPPRKHGDMLLVFQQFKAESEKRKHGRKTLDSLEENMRSAVAALEEMQEKMEGLEKKCRIMRRKLEEEEGKAQEFLRMSEQTVLHLPALPSRPADDPALQEKLMQTVPDPPAVVRALQAEPVLGDVRLFLELAHKQVDAVRASALE